MKRSQSKAPVPPTAETDPFADETAAMVYVGDVYSLVVQEGAPEVTPPAAPPAPKQTEKKPETPQDDNDILWPYIR